MSQSSVLVGLNEISKHVGVRAAKFARGASLPRPPATLYHYTPQTAALNILEKGQLWATHTEYLNDSQEQRHIQTPLTGAWKRLWLTNTAPATRLMMSYLEPTLLGAVTPTEDGSVAGPVDSTNRFVACFCEQPDLLSQWRGYGAQGPAYALGFASAHLPKLRPLLPEPESPLHPKFSSTQLVKVEYDAEVQVETLYRLLNAVVKDIMALLAKSSDSPTDYANGLTNVGVILRWYVLRTFGPRYKDSGFHQEEEWRLIVQSFARDTPLESVSFRPTSLGMAPYLKLARTDWPTDPDTLVFTGESVVGQLPVVEVTQGPIENAGPGLRSMGMMLRKWDYKHNNSTVEVVKSTIPYRPT